MCRLHLKQVTTMVDGLLAEGAGGGGGRGKRGGGAAGEPGDNASLVAGINEAAAGVLLLMQEVLEALLSGELVPVRCLLWHWAACMH